jgi:hypothetical protein
MAVAPVMHEDMHERASEQEQERQHPEEVCPVFRQEIEPGDREEHGESQTRR